MNKWLKVILVIVVLAMVVFLLATYSQKNKQKTENGNAAQSQTTQQPKDYSSSAKVTKITANTIEAEVPQLQLDSANLGTYVSQPKIIRVSGNTLYYTVSKTGKRTPTTLSAVKPGMSITVTSREDMTIKSEVTATVIEIPQ